MIAGIYVRISNEDNLEHNKSTSIDNQITKLTQYVKEENIKLFDVFIDDGYSGANFNRPGFKQLIKAVENNLIDTIIVKDLSRLGRNYIEVGRYVEEYFPVKNIRLICVDDNYDSSQPHDESITLRSFLNHLYLKECSKKIKQSVLQRAKTKNMTLDGCYGYKYNHKKEIVIDEEVKQVVIDIFNDYASGLTMLEISKKLMNNKVHAPGYYRYLRTGKTYSLGNNKELLSNPYKWGTATISRILNNKQYLGHAENIKKSKLLKNQNNNSIIVYDTHEPIIPKALFDIVQNKINKARKFPISEEEKRLKNVVRCHCGYSMTYSSQFGGYDIPIYRCHKCNQTIKANIIHSFLHQECKCLISLTDENILKEIIKKLTFKLDDIEKVKNLQIQKQQIDVKFESLFLQKVQNKITEELYKEKVQLYKEENRFIEKELTKYSNVISKEKLFENNFKKFRNALDNIENIDDEFEVIKTIIKQVIVKKDMLDNKYEFDILYKI